jgi:hypothetical protein
MPRKLKQQRKTVKRTANRHQKGGVGYTLTDCRIGGLSEVRAFSECPQNVGPASADFAKALYSAPILFSGGQAGGARRRKSTKRTTKRKAANCRR